MRQQNLLLEKKEVRVVVTTKQKVVKMWPRRARGLCLESLNKGKHARLFSQYHLKKASKSAWEDETETRKQVSSMLKKIREGGEEAVSKYSLEMDGYDGNVVVSEEEIEVACNSLSQQLKEDIMYAHKQVTKFAQAQKDSIREFEIEVSDGIYAGQKLIPIDCAGCYVPGGRYAHIASAIMSVATAKIAGVKHVIACSSPSRVGNRNGVHPSILFAMKISGADQILALGGVQAIAAMSMGLFTGKKANILVGPGNKFVAEAKQMLHSTSNVGIDMFAGPTEIGIIADASADANLVSEDLCSQCEHGFDSPSWLFTTCDKLANEVLKQMDTRINSLPTRAREAAKAAWRDHGEIIICDNDEELCEVSDRYGAEHLELHVKKDKMKWFVDELKNYGSLFIGEETTVTYGDKCSGTNHILPTKRASYSSGGLSVHKFMKIVTTQRMTRESTKELGVRAARISREEGMEGHARAADIRLKKYFPNESFDVGRK